MPSVRRRRAKALAAAAPFAWRWRPNFAAICIRRPGPQDACPAGWGDPLQLFDAEGFTDGKRGTACACTPAVTCTGGAAVAWDSDDCTPFNNDDEPVGAACTNISAQYDNDFSSMQFTLPAASGTCAPSGGDAMGAVTGMNPITYCCVPAGDVHGSRLAAPELRADDDRSQRASASIAASHGSAQTSHGSHPSLEVHPHRPEFVSQARPGRGPQSASLEHFFSAGPQYIVPSTASRLHAPQDTRCRWYRLVGSCRTPTRRIAPSGTGRRASRTRSPRRWCTRKASRHLPGKSGCTGGPGAEGMLVAAVDHLGARDGAEPEPCAAGRTATAAFAPTAAVQTTGAGCGSDPSAGRARPGAVARRRLRRCGGTPTAGGCGVIGGLARRTCGRGNQRQE